MKLSPMDIKKHEFSPSFRGVDRNEVVEFLESAAARLEEEILARARFEEENSRLQARVAEHGAREQTLRETMMTAQKVAEDVKQAAEKEGRLVVARAEQEAEKILLDALRRKEETLSKIRELRRLKIQFESALRNTIEIHLRLVDSMRDQERSVAAALEDAARAALAGDEGVESETDLIDLLDAAARSYADIVIDETEIKKP